ncbi:MAG: tRNA (guanosine(46)-N7)-methyltransferase TrmB [Bacteroidetes bacterium]|nr:tRNA (guanosine(46)-N7)-methyltransferase TrmB [Bacteroidota bacterium]MBU1372442.1 tRNA (guanosine(46)-N7)-methyltransferase TrmB [Bacteroidota bacterium]MBU1483466.1 tRNA (guanosine(46)-N7)-methyltransferase TrmB [Bacteroidota bacterium]MBU1761146.1 tRNA (guanosine(46)-N7)-methyltransferase TrmB [Bacteroidota bacterium]MBU2046955.1 tRNA (guanosine(46)-N7)-methyltransferase TrmB [Bacteroidota bacterium]
MAKRKLQRFTEIGTFKNVRELEEGKPLKGVWAKEFFKNDHPIILELACGKGEYSVNLGRKYPKKNFIGIDYKGNRLWVGAKMAIDEGIENVGFLRIQIQNIMDYFEVGEIDEIWITFPDPQAQSPLERKRLTNLAFLGKYKTVLKPDGIMHLKTDNDGFFEYTLEKIAELNLPILQKTDNVYRDFHQDEILSIKTHYERIYLQKGKNINYIKFKFNG